MENNTTNNHEINATQKVIVSLTTYPARIDRVNITIQSLLNQTRPADMVVLWLAEEQFPGKENDLPQKLIDLCSRGLIIEWCSDIKSYKKLIPAVEKWPYDIIITADDDIIYRVDTIEMLLKSYERHPDCVSTMRAHLMLFDDAGQVQPYESWKPEYSAFVDQPLMALFPTTGAGTLFPPGVLPDQCFDRESFMKLCPKADDVWVKCMLTISGVRVVLADINTRLQYVEGTQAETLYSYNQTGNDNQLRAVLEEYNEIGGEEYPEDTLLRRMNDAYDHEPDDSFCQKYRKGRSFVNEKLGAKVSVIIAAHNGGKAVRRCVASAVGQTMSDIEIICVNNGSTDDTDKILAGFAAQDSRVRIINLPQRTGNALARREAVMICRGEYCIFPNPYGVLAPDACEQLYVRAEEGDADILAFTAGVIAEGSKAPEPVIRSVAGRKRSAAILEQEFFSGSVDTDRLSSCIFGSRLCRKAYIHVESSRTGCDYYDYFILCRNAEVYVGEETPVYYAAPAHKAGAQECLDALIGIAEYCSFAGIDSIYSHSISELRRRIVLAQAEEWFALSESEKSDRLSILKDVWGAAHISAAIAVLNRKYGGRVLVGLDAHPALQRTVTTSDNAGVVVCDNHSARQLFAMTELLDCVAANRTTVMIGVSKSTASAAVFAAKTTYAGEDMSSEDAADPFVFAERLEKAVKDSSVGVLIVPADSERFVQTVLLGRMSGLAVVAAMAEPLASPMLNCSRPDAGISALALADAVVTDSAAQQKLMSAAGVRSRYIPRPALRLMGGRSSGRASANAIVWTGKADRSISRIDDALSIFRMVQKKSSEARMLLYIDGTDDIDEVLGSAPEGVSVRRLRPDYGVFDDAAVHLMTDASATSPPALRAARTLGIPTVMYALAGENDSAAGTVRVAQRDCEAAAGEIARILEDRQLRDRLSSEAKAASGSCSREEAARLWSCLMEELSVGTPAAVAPVDDLGRTVAASWAFYEDGAAYNAARLEEYRQRCEDYERRLEEAEQRRLSEIAALQEAIDRTKSQLRDKEHARARASGELEDLRSSTLYKVGSAITCIPRRIKKLISGGK